MPTSYTSLLGLALPVTGELSGTWGDTVNDYITKYVDASVAGTQTISGSQTAVTLTRANGGALSQAGSGLTGSSQYQIINCTGNPAGTLTVTIDVSTGSPTLSNSTYSQTFAVINGTSTSQSVVVRATTTSGTSTGTTLVSGEKALIAWNGSDFIKVATSTVDGVSTIAFGTTGLTPSTATSGAVTVAGTLVAANGGTGQSSYTTGDLLYATGSTALSKLGIGTNGQILTSTGTAPQWSTLSGVAVTTFSAGTTGFTPSSATSGAVTLAGTLATTNGGTGLTSFTANGVVYASSSSALTTGSALSFNGTVLQNDQSSASSGLLFNLQNTTTGSYMQFAMPGVANVRFGAPNADAFVWQTFGSGTYPEAMRLTSTGLGIGTSSPTDKLTVSGGSNGSARVNGTDNVFLKLSGAAANEKHIDFYHDNTLAFENYLDGSNNFIWRTRVGGLAERMRLDASGNLGLGVTPSASWANYKVLQIGEQGVISGFASGAGVLNTGANFYWDGSVYRYLTTNPASLYQQNAGAHNWRIAASGTAGNTISFTQAMTLDASGFLGIGQTNPISYLDIYGNGAYTYARFYRSDEAGYGGRVGSGNTLLGAAVARSLGLDGFAGISFGIAGSQVATFNSSGNLGLGVTPSGYLANKFVINTGTDSNNGITIASATNRNGSIWFADGTTGDQAYRGGVDYQHTTDTLYLYSGGQGNFQLTAAGNIGLGVTPSAWQSGLRALQIGATGSIYNNGLNTAFFGLNYYTDSGGTNRYLASTSASAYGQVSGAHQWYTAGSGTAGNAISFTQAMTLDASGNLLAGLTSPLYGTTNRVQMSANGSATAIMSVSHGGLASQSGYMFWDGANLQVANNSASGALIFGTNVGTERARITSGGNVSIGGSADRGTTVGSAALQLFNGTAPAGTLTNGVSLYSSSGDLRFMDAAGNASLVGYRGIPQSGSAKTGSYTLATTDVGEFIQISTGGSIVIPNSTFAAGDVVSLFNNTSGSITITCSTTNAYIAGTDTNKASMTLATRGVATILFVTSTLCVVSGNVT